MKKLLWGIIVIILVIVGAWWLMSHEAKAPTETATPSVSPAASVSPTATVKPSPSATAQGNITITSPKPNAVVGTPLTVTGKARIFENQFSAAITTSDGHVIVRKDGIMSDAKDAGLFGNYSVTFDIPANAPSNIKVIVFAPSPKGDGTYEGYAEVPVHLQTLIIHINQ